VIRHGEYPALAPGALRLRRPDHHRRGGGGHRGVVPPRQALTGSAARRPTPAELAAAADRTLPDLLAPGLTVLFSGINPSLYSAATGHHFARPGNRFWPALHRSGFTPRQLRPAEQGELLALGLGVTNVVGRATARADELTRAELVTGAGELAAKVRRWRPAWLAVVGVTAYRTGFGRPRAVLGPQDETVGGARVWVLPNPSGLNAHFQLDALAEEFARLRRAIETTP
jgi:TDG/mug DNA glycosylase family protein